MSLVVWPGCGVVDIVLLMRRQAKKIRAGSEELKSTNYYTNSKSIVFFSAQNEIFSIGDLRGSVHCAEKLYDSYVDPRC